MARIGDEVERDVVHLVVEKTLFRISRETCELVGTHLKQKYNCHFDQCLEHPEYLLDILASIYGNSAKSIVQSILDEISDLSMTPNLERFHDLLVKFEC